jgi:hypothetical protein
VGGEDIKHGAHGMVVFSAKVENRIIAIVIDKMTFSIPRSEF